jgi:hypothetical protein
MNRFNETCAPAKIGGRLECVEIGVHVGEGIDPITPYCSISHSAEIDL